MLESLTHMLHLIVSAPSGVGKTTIVQQLLREYDWIGKTVSHTTRSARPNEVNGIDYFFVDEPTFHDTIFVEHAQYNHCWYGTSVKEVRKLESTPTCKCIVYIVELVGMQSLKDKLTGTIASLFIAPPSIEELEVRLRSRCTETEQAIENRLKLAQTEMDDMLLFDYIVTNHTVDTTVKQIKNIIDEILTPNKPLCKIKYL